jgi:hypothetical protein
MKRLVAGVAIGLVAGIASTAAGGPIRDFYLNRGDEAVGNGGATGCTAAPHNGSRLGFVCKVGGDYRAAYA